MLKTLTAVMAAALVAGVLTGFPGFGPDIAESSPLSSAVVQIPVAQPDCGQRGWPYQCMDSQAAAYRNIRLITLDRLGDLPGFGK